MKTLIAYHGSGDKAFPKPTEIKPSREGNDYGPGLYLATVWEDVLSYGPFWYEATVALKRPLVVGSPEDAAATRGMMRALKWPTSDIADFMADAKASMSAWAEFFALVALLDDYAATWQGALNGLVRAGYDTIFVPHEIVAARRLQALAPMREMLAVRPSQDRATPLGDYVIVMNPDAIVGWEQMPFQATLARAREVNRKRYGY